MLREVVDLVARFGNRWCPGRSNFRRVVIWSLLLCGVYLVLSTTINSPNPRRLYQTGEVLLHSAHDLSSLYNAPHTSVLSYNRSIFSKAPVYSNLTVTDTLHGNNVKRWSVSRRVLLISDRLSLTYSKEIRVLLQSHRIPYDVHLLNLNQTLILVNSYPFNGGLVGRYCLIICTDMPLLQQHWNLTYLINYSRNFAVPIISFTRPSKSSNVTKTKHYTLVTVAGNMVKGLHLNSSRDFYYLKSKEWFTDVPINSRWVTYIPADSAHKGIEVLAEIKYFYNKTHDMTTPLSLIDTGINDGVQKIFIGSSIYFWMSKLLFLEVIRSYSPHPVTRFGRERWLMIDIDDVFVAPLGLKMTPDDVEALISTQEHLRQYVPGLTFNLGFCGHYYDKGSELEVNGSKKLLQNMEKFWWFGHVYNHYQPHSLNESDLRTYISLNLEFARNHSIPMLENSYAVSPHHSGVYPVHEPLYKAWSELLNVTMTSTEEYPHLYPSHKRRGFTHRGIMVVPRQTCRLFTHNYLFEKFVLNKEEPLGVAKRGRAGVVGVAEGGEVFNSLLNNPVSIFMSHLPNYAKDRLAPVLFTALFKFVTRWTKLSVYSGPPLTLGKKYFSIFPEDKEPLWTSPCRDNRHINIWAKGKNCKRLPSVLILGPQKTGTTALHLFMSVHPNISSNYRTKEHFEEIQFFSNNELYERGVEWYMDQFPYPTAETQVLFEKSATYFTHSKAPQRIHSLLLNSVKLIMILHDPVKRAYSWYQHRRAHGDVTATNYSFADVIKSNESSSPALLALKQHCLHPGRYQLHIVNWLKYFPLSHLHFIDGDELVIHPAIVMATLQRFLQVEEVNYINILRYSVRKHHFCVAGSDGKTNCLGPSKGRLYPQLTKSERKALEEYYYADNMKLVSLLRKLNVPLPTWLKQTLS